MGPTPIIIASDHMEGSLLKVLTEWLQGAKELRKPSASSLGAETARHTRAEELPEAQEPLLEQAPHDAGTR